MKDIAVVIISCDKYADLWKPFFTLFFRYWSDCPFPVYLVANHLCYENPRVITITVGDDHDWSSSMRKALESIQSGFPIILLEDYLLTAAVHTDTILEYAQYMNDKRAACLQLFPRFSPIVGPVVQSDDHPDIGYIDRGAPYRVSLQAAIWDKQALDALLQDGESPWEFETKGTVRSNSLEAPFLSIMPEVKCPIPYFSSAVMGGKWHRDAIRLCNQENIPIDLEVRAQRTLLEDVRFLLLFHYAMRRRWIAQRVASLKHWG